MRVVFPIAVVIVAACIVYLTSSVRQAGVHLDPRVHNVGVVDTESIKEVSTTFKLLNSTPEKMRITNIFVPCICTSAVPTRLELQPGQDSTIKLTIKTKGLFGNRSFLTTIYTDCPAYPYLECEVSGDFRCSKIETPIKVQLGGFAIGEQIIRSIEVPVYELEIDSIQVTKDDQFTSPVKLELQRPNSEKKQIVLLETMAPDRETNFSISAGIRFKDSPAAEGFLVLAGHTKRRFNCVRELYFGVVKRGVSTFKNLEITDINGGATTARLLESKSPFLDVSNAPVRESSIEIVLNPGNALAGGKFSSNLMLECVGSDGFKELCQIAVYAFIEE